ncbi:hypothetical protein TNCV_583911 [Trichonephila clavipes]|nr:hypothetical protein TNCV_583911 [Trichonephila clavipes]
MASASAQNGWRKRDGSRPEKEPKKGEGRGNKRRQSQPGRDEGKAKHETGQNDDYLDRPNPFPRPLSALIGFDQSKRSKQGISSFGERTSSAAVF